MRIHRLRLRYRLAPGKPLHLGGQKRLTAQRGSLRPTLALHPGDSTPIPA